MSKGRALKNTTDSYEIYDHFRETGAHAAARDLSDLFNVFSHGDDVQGFDTRWHQTLSAASEIPTENVLEGLYFFFFSKQKRDSVQLQTVLALYDQEIDRNLALPSYQRLRTMVRQHIDQTIGTRNFKTWKERFETSAFVESRSGRKRQCGKTWKNVFSGKQLDSVLFCRRLGNAGTVFDKSRRTRICNRPRRPNAHAEGKGFELRRDGNSSKIQEPRHGGHGQWGSADER